MVSSSQIRNSLARYIFGEIAFLAFEDWIVRNTWNIHSSGSTAAEALTFDIEDALSEFSSGRFDECQLRQELSRILHAENKVVEVDLPIPGYSFRSAPARVLVLASV